MSNTKFILAILLVAVYAATAVAVQQHGADVLQAASMVNETVADPVVGTDGCSSMCRWETYGPCQHPDEENNVCFNMTEGNWCPVGSIECGSRPTENGPQVYFVPKAVAPVASSSAAASAAASVTPVASSSAAVSVTPVSSSSAAASVTPVASSSAAVSITSSAAASVTPVASSSAAVSITPVASVSASTSSSYSSSHSRPPTASTTSAPSSSPSATPSPEGLFAPYQGRLSPTVIQSGLTVAQENFVISFDMKMLSAITATSNVFHFSKGRQCCDFGDVSPAFFVNPDQTMQFVFGNPLGCDGHWTLFSTYRLSVGTSVSIELKMTKDINGSNVAEIWFDGVRNKQHTLGFPGGACTRETLTGMTFAMSSTFGYVPAPATVDNWMMYYV